jgi:hypothetical protein
MIFSVKNLSCSCFIQECYCDIGFAVLIDEYVGMIKISQQDNILKYLLRIFIFDIERDK